MKYVMLLIPYREQIKIVSLSSVKSIQKFNFGITSREKLKVKVVLEIDKKYVLDDSS